MDDCDCEKNITAIDYVDEDSYELFEREIRIEVRNQIVSIKNLNDCYQLDMSRALCDYFCNQLRVPAKQFFVLHEVKCRIFSNL